MKFLFAILLMTSSVYAAEDAYTFLKRKSSESKPKSTFNQYEDIISGSLAFVIGNVGYFTTDSSALKIAYSGVQTVGIIAVGHGIHDFYYPHFESRLLDLLQKEKLSRKELSDGYIRLLGERDRATRVALLWSSSLLTVQYGFNAILSEDVPQDLKDIYLFLGGVNAIVSIYSYFNKTDYEQYYLRRQQALNVGFILSPEGKDTKAGLALTKTW